MTTPQWSPGHPAIWCRKVDEVLDLRTFAQHLQRHPGPLVWLDSARTHPITGCYSMLAWDPWVRATAVGAETSIVTTTSRQRVWGNPFETVRRLCRRYPGPSMREHIPAVGVGWYALLGYELNRWIERLPAPKSTVCVPELVWYGMSLMMIVDHMEQRSWLVSIVDPHQPSRAASAHARERLDMLDELRHALAATADDDPRPRLDTRSLEPTSSAQEFEVMVQRAQEEIRAGEIFQVNLAQRFETAWGGSAWALSQALRRINPSPFACFWQDHGWALVSCSPERLVRVDDGVVEARPIAGTRPRGARPEDDLVNSLELILSDKERAEHIMLVDLARNDLGRVCRAGSVLVNELMALEDYSHVMHIVSNVRGRLQSSMGPMEVVRALFPGGTITGCPKVRAMELIHELEPVARGPYTGSAGWIGFDGAMDLNILIRTMVATPGRVNFHVGAGIVADSVPAREYAETLAKGAALCEALRAGGQVEAVDALRR